MKIKKALSRILIMGLIFAVSETFASTTLAAENSQKTEKDKSVYYPKTVTYNAGKGYSKENNGSDKTHYGWKLGEFVVTGFSKHTTDDDGNLVFVKTKSDTIRLSYNLEQDITKLNGNKKISIVDDKKGQDKVFETPVTDFKKGALLIRYTSPENKTDDPLIYTNFLTGKSEKAPDMSVELNEEGDYEVALDYMVQKSRLNLFGKQVIPEEDRYRESFSFFVRNGNNIGFIFDSATRGELKNCSFTKNGFYIDLAGSKYISIDIKREKLVVKDGKPTLDIRANTTARDKEEFSDEGVYTITFRDDYEPEPTTKRIYVGDDDLLKAYIITGKPLEEIQSELDNGATVGKDGNIIPASKQENISDEESSSKSDESTTDYQPIVISQNDDSKKSNVNAFPYIIIVIILAIILHGIHKSKRKKKKEQKAKVIAESVAQEAEIDVTDNDKENDENEDIEVGGDGESDENDQNGNEDK